MHNKDCLLIKEFTTTDVVGQDEYLTKLLTALLVIQKDGSLGHKVFRKPTDTVRYLHYNSFHHPSIKNSVCKTLINRAKTIYEVDNIEGELEHLRSVLKMNGYPKKFIDNAMITQQHVREKPEYQSSVSLPYNASASHKIERILKEAGIKVYHSSDDKLFRSLCTHEFQKPSVYRIQCECRLVYIGETGRNLLFCLKET